MIPNEPTPWIIHYVKEPDVFYDEILAGARTFEVVLDEHYEVA